MTNSLYAYQHYLLRSLSVEFKQPEVKQIALKPGVNAVYRVTCHYPEGQPPNSVATVVGSQAGKPTLTVVHENAPDAPTEFTLDANIYRALGGVFSASKFDKLDDQPDIPAQGVTLWLLERAAGSFVKSVLLAPELARDAHQTLVFRLHEYLPQAVEIMS